VNYEFVPVWLFCAAADDAIQALIDPSYPDAVRDAALRIIKLCPANVTPAADELMVRFCWYSLSDVCNMQYWCCFELSVQLLFLLLCFLIFYPCTCCLWYIISISMLRSLRNRR